jgi:hypothetical protein
MSGIDLNPHHGGTISVRRQGVELARAAIGAIAIGELPAMQGPFQVHFFLPEQMHEALPPASGGDHTTRSWSARQIQRDRCAAGRRNLPFSPAKSSQCFNPIETFVLHTIRVGP